MIATSSSPTRRRSTTSGARIDWSVEALALPRAHRARARAPRLDADADGRRREITPPDFAARFPSSRGAIYGLASNSRMAAFKRPANTLPGIDGLYFCGGTVHPGAGLPMVALSARIATRLALRTMERHEVAATVRRGDHRRRARRLDGRGACCSGAGSRCVVLESRPWGKEQKVVVGEALTEGSSVFLAPRDRPRRLAQGERLSQVRLRLPHAAAQRRSRRETMEECHELLLVADAAREESGRVPQADPDLPRRAHRR